MTTMTDTESLVRQFAAADPQRALQHFTNRLVFEADAADVAHDLEAGVEGVIVIDARIPELYARGHIPGAHSLPHRTITAESTAWLSKEAVIVTYCDGIGCNASTKAAIKLSALGFQVKEMIGGFDWWQRDGLPVATGTTHGGLTSTVKCGC